MNSMMDVIISFVIAGMIILIVVQVDSNVKASSIFIEQDLHAQQFLKLTADVMNWELRKIGHCLAYPERAIKIADTARIVFDYNKNSRAVQGFNDGDSIRVEYLFNVLDENTPNPRDKKFIRKVNGASHNGYSLGLTRVNFQYYNKQGNLLAAPVHADSLKKIKTIRVNLGIESKESFKDEYSRFIYSMRVTPKNLLGI